MKRDQRRSKPNRLNNTQWRRKGIFQFCKTFQLRKKGRKTVWASQDPEQLTTRVSSPTNWATYLVKTCILFPSNSSKANVDSFFAHAGAAKPLCGLGGRAAAKERGGGRKSKAGEQKQGRKRDGGVSQRESKLTKCDWYSGLPNPHPPWLTRSMNNSLREREGGKEAERERERESTVCKSAAWRSEPERGSNGPHLNPRRPKTQELATLRPPPKQRQVSTRISPPPPRNLLP